jgi:hypothetical protein
MITELIFGGLIHHFTITPRQIDRTQFRPNLIIKHYEFNLLLGSNSIGRPIIGGALDFPYHAFKFKLGAYIQDNNDFEDIGVEVNVGDVVPIVALEFKKPLTKKWGLTTIISNFIGFGGISYEF